MNENKTVKVEILNVVRRFPESGWGTITVMGDSGKPGTAVGVFPESVGPGDIVELDGYWDRHQKFGLQFKFNKITTKPPDLDTSEGIFRLLQRLPWIGPVKAEAAIDEHGHEKAWKLATTDPIRIGVPTGRVEQVKEAAKKLLSGFEEQVYFLSLELTQHQINKLVLQYGHGRDGAMKVIKEEPYRALEIDGFGFLTVDRIALQSGVNPGAEGRISACVEYFLEDSGTNQGHIWFYRNELINGSKRYNFDGVLAILKKTAMSAEVPIKAMPTEEDVERVLLTLEAAGKVVIDKGKIYNTELKKAEEAIFIAAMGG